MVRAPKIELQDVFARRFGTAVRPENSNPKNEDEILTQ